MEVALLLVRDGGEVRRFPVRGAAAVIGRRPDCDVRIPLGDVSRRHCTLTQQGKRVVLQDLDSSNGTYVNGSRAREAELRPGDRVRIGPLSFVVQIDGEPTEAEVLAARPAGQLLGDASASDVGLDATSAGTPISDLYDES